MVKCRGPVAQSTRFIYERFRRLALGDGAGKVFSKGGIEFLSGGASGTKAWIEHPII